MGLGGQKLFKSCVTSFMDNPFSLNIYFKFISCSALNDFFAVELEILIIHVFHALLATVWPELF